MKRWSLLLASALVCGCGSVGKPPLPKFAVSQTPRPAPPPDPWAAKLGAIDVIYFGLTKRSDAETQPAWRIVASLQTSGARVALGWTDLPATQQPLLDQWQRQEISGPQLLDRLAGTARGDWLSRALRPDLLHLALGAPPELLRKIRAGAALTTEERALLANDYRPRPDAFDNFADRVATSALLRRYDLRRLYRAHLAAEQMIADNIVRFMRDHPEVKLLVFLPDDAMIDPREVADFAGQKTALRQLILDRTGKPAGARAQLLASR